MEPRGCFDIKMPSYRCMNSHYRGNSVSNPYYLLLSIMKILIHEKMVFFIETGFSCYLMHIACNILWSFIVLFSDTALGHKCRKHAHGFFCFALLWSYHHAFEGLLWSHIREDYFNHTYDCPSVSKLIMKYIAKTDQPKHPSNHENTRMLISYDIIWVPGSRGITA